MFKSAEPEHSVIEDELQDDEQSGTEEAPVVGKRCRRRGRHGRRKGSRAGVCPIPINVPASDSQDSDDSPPMSVLELFGLAVGHSKAPVASTHRSVVTWNDLGKEKKSLRPEDNTMTDRNSPCNDTAAFPQTVHTTGYAHDHFNGGFVRMPATPLNVSSCHNVLPQWGVPSPQATLMPHNVHQCGTSGFWQIQNSDWALHQPVQHTNEVFVETNSVPHFSFAAPVKTAPDVQPVHQDALVEWVGQWGTNSPASRTGIEEMLRASVPTTYED